MITDKVAGWVKKGQNHDDVILEWYIIFFLNLHYMNFFFSEKYSAYQPTPVSIQHFIKFANNACPQSSFLFLKRELPVRLANIMKELQLLPHQLHDTHACKVRHFC